MICQAACGVGDGGMLNGTAGAGSGPAIRLLPRGPTLTRGVWRRRDRRAADQPAVSRPSPPPPLVRRLLSGCPTVRTLGALIASALLVVAAFAARGRILGEVATEASAAPSMVAPADPHAVATVRIIGKNLPIAALERALSTRPGHRLSDDDLARDRTAILATLEARGHLGASITGVRVAWHDGAHVVFDVTSAGVYQVDGVTVTGAPAAYAAELAVVPTLLRGQPWHPERAADNVSLLRDWLAHRGTRAEVTARRTIDHVTHTVDVAFEIKPAPRRRT
jgi:hypothetical protein